MPTKTKKQSKRKIVTRKAKPEGKKTINFKVKPSEVRAIKAMARKITRGNVSALVVGALKYAPQHSSAISKGDFRATTRK